MLAECVVVIGDYFPAKLDMVGLVSHGLSVSPSFVVMPTNPQGVEGIAFFCLHVFLGFDKLT